MKSIEPESGYKYLGILKANVTKHNNMKVMANNEYLKRVGKILASKSNARNIISAIDSCVVAVVWYGAGILRWTGVGLNELDRKTRKLLTMHGAHNPRAAADRLHMKRVNVGGGLISVEDCVRI